MMATALVFGLASCNNEEDKNLDAVVEDGFYVCGPATAITDLAAEGAVKGLMAAGTNEVDKAKRAGMYEKYIALEGGKEFELVLHEGQSEIHYGAELALSDTLEGDNVPQIRVYQGVMAENTKMQVAESGLYHIILDLNVNDDLSNKLIMVVPVEWGVRGAMNGWGYTPLTASEFNKTSITYTIDCTVESTGDFKFAHSNGWKFQLDQAGLVKAENNIGTNAETDGGEYTSLLPGGKNIPIARGKWNLKLTWSLESGALEKSFAYTPTKTGELQAIDYSNCEMELVGSGVAETNAGAAPDANSGWNWGNVLSAGKPAVDGTTYTWTWSNVALLADGFKIRTIDAKESGGVAGFDLGGDKLVDDTYATNDGGNIKPKAAGNYNIVLTIDAAADTKQIKITAAE